MSGIMSLYRRKGDRLLLKNHKLESWRDENQTWSLPQANRPPISEEKNYYDTYRFEHHPRCYSPSAARRMASGYRTRFPKRPPHDKDAADNSADVARIAAQRQAERDKREATALVRKRDALLWTLPRVKCAKERDAVLGPYRDGQYTRKDAEFSVRPLPRAPGYPGGAPRIKPTFNTREFAFTEAAAQDSSSEQPVSKYSISQRIDNGENVVGYQGHVMGYRYTHGTSYGRATRKALHGYEPSPY